MTNYSSSSSGVTFRSSPAFVADSISMTAYWDKSDFSFGENYWCPSHFRAARTPSFPLSKTAVFDNISGRIYVQESSKMRPSKPESRVLENVRLREQKRNPMNIHLFLVNRFIKTYSQLVFLRLHCAHEFRESIFA